MAQDPEEQLRISQLGNAENKLQEKSIEKQQSGDKNCVIMKKPFCKNKFWGVKADIMFGNIRFYGKKFHRCRAVTENVQFSWVMSPTVETVSRVWPEGSRWAHEL